ncbi:MAG: glycosyltransferase family 4 protein, partial [Frankia sp.]
MVRAPDAPVVLLLAPSDGLGGGIERYVASVVAALQEAGTTVVRIDLRGPDRPLTVGVRIRFAVRAVTAGLRHRRPAAVLVGHPHLLPVAAAVVAVARARRAPVLFYGTDIFALGRGAAAWLRRGRAFFPVTISGYSAGALARFGATPVLPPVLGIDWRDTLVAAGALRDTDRSPAAPARVLTVFRLEEWESKGLPELLAATAGRRSAGDVRLVVAGRGPAPSPLRAAVGRRPGVELVESPSDRALARLYAEADLFVLCTRTRTRPPYSGEGFGMVLTEAQLTGCAVIGPASGGSRDAYRESVTGRTPVDESAEALERLL